MILNSSNWEDELFLGEEVPSGYRILIDPGQEAEQQDVLDARRLVEERLDSSSETIEPSNIPGSRIPQPVDSPADDGPHVCGGSLRDIKHQVDCPNCQNPLFPVFQLEFDDYKLSALDVWKEKILHVLVCPFCFFYMQPYWIIYDSGKIQIHGGLRDGGKICNNVTLPYETRKIQLRALSFDDYPLTEGNAEALDERWHPPGIYHQIGGLPPIGGYDEMNCCKCQQLMHFAGVVDYDDQNVPLYENNGVRMALIIGDMRNLNFFTCPKCTVIGIKLAPQ